MQEIDLYKPIENYYSALGYTVKAEVKDCDVVCQKEEETIIIELKLQFSLKLIYQAMDRQALTSQVYIAIPRPKKAFFGKEWHRMLRLVKSLHLGLILMDHYGQLEFVCHPSDAYTRRLNGKKKKALDAEFSKRKTSANLGGTRGKTITAYRESALQLARLMTSGDIFSPKMLNAQLSIQNASQILNANYYGWFDKVDRGQYQLSDQGRAALITYGSILEQL